MKIATYNINGINGRLPILLLSLKEQQLNVGCLKELKTPQDKFMTRVITDAGVTVLP